MDLTKYVFDFEFDFELMIFLGVCAFAFFHIGTEKNATPDFTSPSMHIPHTIATTFKGNFRLDQRMGMRNRGNSLSCTRRAHAPLW